MAFKKGSKAAKDHMAKIRAMKNNPKPKNKVGESMVKGKYFIFAVSEGNGYFKYHIRYIANPKPHEKIKSIAWFNERKDAEEWIRNAKHPKKVGTIKPKKNVVKTTTKTSIERTVAGMRQTYLILYESKKDVLSATVSATSLAEAKMIASKHKARTPELAKTRITKVKLIRK